jgi:hypothetical protein
VRKEIQKSCVMRVFKCLVWMLNEWKVRVLSIIMSHDFKLQANEIWEFEVIFCASFSVSKFKNLDKIAILKVHMTAEPKYRLESILGESWHLGSFVI